MMLELTAEAIDALVGILFLKDGVTLSLEWERFQLLWIVVFGLMWTALLQVFSALSISNPNRVLGLLHAITMVSLSAPVLWLLTTPSSNYYTMLSSLINNHVSLAIRSNVMCYISVGYFLMDSYFLVRRAYLKHHIGAIITWLFASYHHDTSLVHGVVVIGLFETGAILVQLSRVLPKTLFLRTLICSGYTSTRLGLAWYYGFIMVTSIEFYPTASILGKLGYFVIWSGLIFLLVLNFKWTSMQWRALAQAYHDHWTKGSDQTKDFFTYHQEIIGNVNRQSVATN